jgi:hypothetical protein
LADRTPVTATVGNGGLSPSGPGAVEEWLAFNASVRRAGERKGCLSFPSRVASSEAEMIPPSPEGRLATLERGGGAVRGRGLRRGALEQGGDHPAGPRGVRMSRTAYVGRVLGFFESFPFFQLEGGCRPLWARLPNMCLCF